MIVPQNQSLTYVELWVQAQNKTCLRIVDQAENAIQQIHILYVVNGCCISCGGTNLQQGPTTVKHDTRAPVQSPASSPHTTPTPNQDDPSRHYSDVGNTLATVFPPHLGRQGGLRKSQKRFVPGCCIPCGGANLQQGPTTVKHDTGAPVQSPASSPHNTPTPNQGAPSRHYRDVGNTLATGFPSTRETRCQPAETT